MDQYIVGLADITTLDYLLHNRACRSLSWREVVQMAQACKSSRFLVHAPAAAAAITSSKIAAYATALSACAHDEITAAPAWQANSSRDGRVKRGAHYSRNDEQQAYASAARPSYPQKTAPSSVAHAPPPCSKAENSARASDGKGQSDAKPRAIK